MDGSDSVGGGVRRSDAPGTLLAAAREAQSLSVADVARQLKLSVHQVEALESGSYHLLPGPVFVRGFVRNYARLLKIEADVLHAAAQSLPPVEARPAAPPSQEIPFPAAARPRWPAYVAAGVAIVAALALYEFYTGEREAEVARPAAAPPLAVATTPAAPAPATGEAPAVAPDAAGDAASATTASAPSAGAEPAPPPAVPASSNEAGIAERDDAAAPQPGERQVHMVFDQESWVEIRDRSGKAIFSQLNRRGTEQRVNGRPPLSVIVGNAHGVKLTYDEQPVDLARHTKIDVARLTLE